MAASVVQASMKALLLSGDYSDMTITCQENTFRVHSSILCTQSDFFKAAMSRSFKEGKAQTVDLSTDDPRAIERLLCFLYYKDYEEHGHLLDVSHTAGELDRPPSESKPMSSSRKGTSTKTKVLNSTDSLDTAYVHLQVYSAADKYGVTTLQESAAERFGTWCEKYNTSDNLIDVLEDAKTIAMNLPNAIYLTDTIARVIADNVQRLVRDGYPFKHLKAYPALADAVVFRLVGDSRIWEPEKDGEVAQFVNNILWKGKCNKCKDDNFRVEMDISDFKKNRFRCMDCGALYDITTFDLESC